MTEVIHDTVIEVPTLDPRARETSFKEYVSIQKAYKEILGMNYIDHFSINVVPKNQGMLVFSMNPEIAYTVYSSRRGIEQDLAISPTFYNNFNFYFWEDCYSELDRYEIMQKKEKRYGIKSGAVIVYEDNNDKYLLSFGTKSNRDNFMQDVFTNQAYYKTLGLGVLSYMQDSIFKYFNYAVQKQPKDNICYFNR